MASTPPPRPPPRGRPRQPALDRALLTAALEVLEARGYGGFTLEAVARQAGTGKATLYRRWRSAADLLLSALAHHGAATVPARVDEPLGPALRRFFRSAFRQLNGRRGLLLRSLMAEAQRDEAFRVRFREVFVQSRRAALGAVLRAAQARGELAAGARVELLLDYLFGVMWYRLLVAHAPLNDALIADFVRLAARPGRGSRRPREP